MQNTYEKYAGQSFGTPAPGNTISVHTPLAKSQRDLNETKVKEYLNQHEGINWDLFGYVKGMRFGDGREVIYDGQHRIFAVKKILPHIKEVPAHIVDGSPELAAKYFDAVNGGSSSNLNSEQKFFAKVEAGDEFAKEIETTIKKTKWSIGKVNAAKTHRPAKYANAVKAIGFGESAFLRSCDIIDQVFPEGPADNLLSGMSRLLSMDEYKELGNPNKAIGQRFVQWLINIKTIGATPKNLEFKKYRNTGPWYDAIAYGLARHFFQTERSQGRSVPSIKTIKDVWEKPVKDADDFESLVF